MKCLLVIFSIICSIAVTCAQVILTPAQDTDLYQFSTYPTGTTYSLGVNSSGGAGHSQKTLIQFDPTASKLGMSASEIGRAVLRLYILPDDPSNGYGGVLTPGMVSVHAQSVAWNVNTVRWSTASPGAVVGSISVTQPSTSTSAVWIEVDVTATVKAWVAGSMINNGFVLKSADEMASPMLNVLFASMETGFPPQLVVTKAAAAPFQVTSMTMNGDQVSLTWNSVSGKSYLVRESPDLVNWTTRQTVAATSTQSSATVTKTVYPAGRGFYRIELVP